MAKGYTKIENKIFDSLLKLPISDTEFRVMVLLLRYTKGFPERDFWCEASYSFIAKGIQKSEATAKRAVKSLIDKGYISILQKSMGKQAQRIRVNYKFLCGHFCNPYVVISESSCGQIDVPYVVTGDPQEIKEEIKDKEIKKEEKASPIFSSLPDVSKMTMKQFAEYANSLPDDDEEE